MGERIWQAMNAILSTRSGLIIYLLVFVAIWTLIPLFSNAGLPVDTVEELAWARDWPLGIYRHPPMMLWLVEIAYRASFGWMGSPYLLSGLSYATGVFSLFVLMRRTRPASQAGLAVMLTPLIYFFGPHLPQWNANTAQLPFAGLFLLVAFVGVVEGSLLLIVLAGALAAAGVLAKYSFALIVIFAAIALLVHKPTRSKIKPLHLLAGFVTGIVVMLPHLYWLEAAPLNTLAYSKMSLDRTNGAGIGHLVSPLLLILETIAFAIPIVLFAKFGTKHSAGSARHAELDGPLKSYLGFSVLGSVAVFAIVGAIGGGNVKDQWLMAYFLAFPFFLVMQVLPANLEIEWKKSAAILYLVIISPIAAEYPITRAIRYYGPESERGWAPLMPAEPLAKEAIEVWESAIRASGLDPSTKPIAIVGGGVEAAAIANVLPVRPKWFEYLNQDFTPWVTDQDIRQYGLLVTMSLPPDFAKTHDLCVAAEKDFDWKNGAGLFVQRVRLTVLLPSSLCKKLTP